MRSAGVAVLAVLAALVGGCGGTPDDILRFGLPTAPTTLDPRYASDAISVRLSRLIDCRLVEFDHRSRPVPGAADWRRESPTRYRFDIRPGITFDDGSALVAADVVATYRAVRDPATASPHRLSLANIEHVAARDERTVEFILHQADAVFPGVLVVGLLPARTLAAGGRADRAARAPGCGQFAVESRRADGTVVLRRRRDDQRVAFPVVRNAAVRGWKLLGGELDLVQGNVSPDMAAWLDRRDGVSAVSTPGNTFTYLGFNLRDGPTANAAVRRAVAHAIDREAIVRHLFRGRARLADAIFPPEHWAGADDLQPLSHDPRRARELLVAAGISLPLELEFKTSSDPFRMRVATAIQSQLAAAGITLRIRSLDWATFFGDVRAGRFQLYALSWVGLRQPDIFRYAFHSDAVPPAGANRGGYRDAAVDRLIEQAETTDALAARAALYGEIERRLLDDLPYVPLWFEDQIFVTRTDIRAYATNADGHFDALLQTHRGPRASSDSPD